MLPYILHRISLIAGLGSSTEHDVAADKVFFKVDASEKIRNTKNRRWVLRFRKVRILLFYPYAYIKPLIKSPKLFLHYFF